MAFGLFLYSVLVNMNQVNKVYCFDWMILINTEYVVYSLCVCVLTCMWIEYILYIIVYKVPVFLVFFLYYY